MAHKVSKPKAKFKKVMHEFGEGILHSGSKKGRKVTNPKQAVAIAFSEERRKAKHDESDGAHKHHHIEKMLIDHHKIIKKMHEHMEKMMDKHHGRKEEKNEHAHHKKHQKEHSIHHSTDY